MVLRQLQNLLGHLYDVPAHYDVCDFLLTDRSRLASLIGDQIAIDTDEQVFIAEEADGPRLGVYIDQTVLLRLAERNPLNLLNEDNLGDYCTALEGVSHFHYLAWSLALGRNVSLLELELQAEIDKYAAALLLRMSQSEGRFPQELHSSLFFKVGFLPDLDAASLYRYREASHYAARYCRSLDERYLRRRCRRPEAWLAELRRLYRYGHHEKMRHAATH